LAIWHWRPSRWVGLSPNGIGYVKPNHYKDMAIHAWRNRRQLPFAWRILKNGVCDGCALGTTGVRDFTLSGFHLCTVRTALLEMNTADALDPSVLRDVSELSRLSSGKLRALGRLPYPMVRRKGEPGFARLSWDDALDLVAGRIRDTDPKRMSFYLTSRGITNEAYYVAQKAARFMGTNNVDNSSRVCHAPSTTALKETLGVAASTCSYVDWLETDLLVFIGSDVPNNQPVTTKYIYHAKRNGAKVATINPFREPGLERYWIPSMPESALFGTKITDRFFQVHGGGDIAFLNGTLKHLFANGWEDVDFIKNHTGDIDALKASLASQDWETLEAYSGSTRDEMLEFAKMLANAKKAVFVWSMGLTQHRFGVQNVEALANVALSRGFVGRDGCGLMAIRGHSGVQGSAEVGAVPWQFPGGAAVDAPGAADHMREQWGFDVPAERGLTAVESIDAAHAGEIDVLYSVGGNFLETLPEPRFVHEALARVPLRVHQDIVVSSQMLVEPADTVVLLPAATRYEQRGGGTETSTERRIYFSPEIPGRRVGEARAEFDIFMELAKRVRPDDATLMHFHDSQAIRDEIAKVVPLYAGIETLHKKGDAIQWGGRTLCKDGAFGTVDGLAHFATLVPPEVKIPEGEYLMACRRGRQFNSMVQADRDPLTGARRADVLIAKADGDALGLREGDAIVLRSDVGELAGRYKPAAIKPRNVQVHWPEGNALLKRGATDPVCGIPDYHTTVTIERAQGGPTGK
jgi:molybdopterin-dependent oxidoreductase alpha subunit